MLGDQARRYPVSVLLWLAVDQPPIITNCASYVDLAVVVTASLAFSGASVEIKKPHAFSR